MNSLSLKWQDIKDKVVSVKNINFSVDYGKDILGFNCEIYDYFKCPRCEAIIEPVNFSSYQKCKCHNCNLNIYPFYGYYSDYSKRCNVISALVWDDNINDYTFNLIKLIKKYSDYLFVINMKRVEINHEIL